MPNPRNRRPSDLTESAVKAVLALILLAALGIGGLAGFTTVFVSLIFLLGILAVFALACFVVIKCRFQPAKKIGLLLVLGAVLLGTFWSLLKAPPQWPQTFATITRLTAPTVSVTATYRYEVAHLPFDYTRKQDFKDLADAQKQTPASLTLYYNPANPAEASEKASTRWTKVPSALTRATPQNNGTYQAQVRANSGFLTKTFGVQGDFLATLKAGGTFPIWANPLNPDEFSLQPKLTVGGGRYPLLATAIGLAVVGMAFLLKNPKNWLVPRSSAVAATAPPRLVPTTKEALRNIDWYQFEKVSARLLEIDGWNVTRRGGAQPDGGADLIAQRNDKSVVVQCKHWKNWEIPPKIMRELLGTRMSAGFTADSAMLFTLNRCTSEAERFAVENGITIYDADRIASLVDLAGIGRFPEITQPENKQCPKCDAPMVLRASTGGSFWGCSRFGPDRCRGRIDA